MYVFLYGRPTAKAVRAFTAFNGISKLRCIGAVLLFNSPRLHHFFLFVCSELEGQIFPRNFYVPFAIATDRISTQDTHRMVWLIALSISAHFRAN